MNIALAFITLATTQGQAQVSQEKPTASQLLTKVLSRYSTATSVSGNIVMTQSAQGQTINVVTKLQYERPGKIFLAQQKNGKNPDAWLLVSDGETFSYNDPNDATHVKRNTEYRIQNGIEQKVADLYMAAERSLGDLNPILDIAISQPVRLQRLKEQWATLNVEGTAKVNGIAVQRVTGLLRVDAKTPAAGTFEIDVTDEGDIVRYGTSQKYSFPDISKEVIEVTTIWDSNLKVGGKIDPALYKVIR